MKFRVLGKSDLRVSIIGFGCWGLGGDAYGALSEKDGVTLVHSALDQGICFFDTSDFYGMGRSEELLGRALMDRRDQAVIASKVGFTTQKGDQDFSPAYMEGALDQTLLRLKTKYLDLYQLHNPDPKFLKLNPQVLETLKQFKKMEKIKAWGISTKTPEEALECIELGPDTLQVNFNLLDQRAATLGVFERCRTENIGLIGRTPLCFGFLSGQYATVSDFGAQDHRNRWPVEQRRVWSEGIDKFLDVLGQSAKGTKVQQAIRFCISHDELGTVIPGMMTVDQIKENLGALELPDLSVAEKKNCLKIFDQNRFFLN